MTLAERIPVSVSLPGGVVADGALEPSRRVDFDFDIAVLGLGYVGLPTALAFHAAGRRVLGVDISPQRLEVIRSQRADLLGSDRGRLSAALDDERLQLSSSPAALGSAACVIVCVPTPVDSYLVPDLDILRAACAQVVAHAAPGQLLMLTSTTYVGTTFDLLVRPLTARGLVCGRDICVAFSPERIDPGNDAHAHEDVPRVVGGVTPECTRRALEMLSGYARTLHPVSSCEAAEMTKLLENTFRAVNIAMVNEFAEASGALQLDVMEVIRAAATKPYGYMPFTPGPGVGGHCIPCDPYYLLWQLRKQRLPMPLVEQAMAGIAARPRRVVDRARDVLSQRGTALSGARVLVVGVAYKPDVEDLRESPAIEVIERLLDAGAVVSFHDPFVPILQLPGGRRLEHVTAPDGGAADLVLVHTLHSGLDRDIIERAGLVLDATYRVDPRPNMVRL